MHGCRELRAFEMAARLFTKHKIQVRLLFPVLLAVVALRRLAEGSCFVSTEGIALQGHVIETFTELDMLACYQRCKQEERCQSLNFYDSSSTCQINNRTIAMKPWDSVGDRNADYFENPFRVLIGSKKLVPAFSCQEIKNASSTVTSGRYWLNDAPFGEPIEVYCNMKIEKAVKEGCKVNQCQHGGSCDYYGNDKYKCSCVGYTGMNCEIDIDDCSSNPCQNGGTCRDGVHNFTCSCPNGFTGNQCQLYDAPECKSQRNLSEATRNVSYDKSTEHCDKDQLPTAWYRFTGAAGIKMPTTCVPINHCDTSAPGWLNGTEPAQQDGAVNRTACFHWDSNCCYWSIAIRVRNCGAFLVYELKAPPFCHYRYCGTD